VIIIAFVPCVSYFYSLFNFSHVGRPNSFAEWNYRINPLKTKTNTFALKAQYVPRSKHSYSQFSWLQRASILTSILLSN